MTGALNSHDGHDFDRPSDSIQEIAPALAPGINPEQIVPSEDGWMDPAMDAAHSSALEPNTHSTSYKFGTLGLVSGYRIRTACVCAYRIWLGTGHGVHRRGYFSTLALRWCAKLIKVSFLVGIFLAELCLARVGSGR